MRLAALILALTMVAAPSAPRGARPRATAPDLVGTWRLVFFEDVEGDHKVYPFGEKPSGVLVYTADGHMAALLVNPANPKCIPPSGKPYSKLDACTPAEMQQILEHSVAYWGTYTVDAAKEIIVHHVEGDIANAYTGTDQQRPFHLEGDRLVLGNASWPRIFERVR